MWVVGVGCGLLVCVVGVAADVVCWRGWLLLLVVGLGYLCGWCMLIEIFYMYRFIGSGGYGIGSQEVINLLLKSNSLISSFLPSVINTMHCKHP